MNSKRIEAAEKFGRALNSLSNLVETDDTERNRAAAASFGIAADHHGAIVLLLKSTFYSSSFALLRCLFEAYLRGLWVKYCADDAQVAAFIRADQKPPETMVADIEATPAFAGGSLSRIKKQHWGTMCDFTHTGGLHLQRWQSKEGIEPTFEPAELEECLNLAEVFGALATLELVQMRKTGDNGAAVAGLIRQRWPR
jgi:hypothetical protein